MCTHFAIIQETENNSEKDGEGGGPLDSLLARY